MFSLLENALRAHRFGLTEGVQWFWQDSRKFLQRGSVILCVNGTPVSVLVGILFSSLCSFTQFNPEMGFPFEQVS
jgi:hypothetical protein